jgi:hypothetical protein
MVVCEQPVFVAAPMDSLLHAGCFDFVEGLFFILMKFVVLTLAL